MALASKKVLFMQAGGSIDKEYPRIMSSYAFEIGEPATKRILERVNPNFDYEIKSLMRKDSLDLTDLDREMIYLACRDAVQDTIVITHGTDTMTKTAELLLKYKEGIKDKKIVITGSMRPERCIDSDADFNVGVAVGALNVLERGIYIAMNGVIYPAGRVVKDPETVMFIEK